MNDGELLLRQILNNPADDLARLVYADWLEEQGSKPLKDKAEFIRCSIELETASDKEKVKLRHWIMGLFKRNVPDDTKKSLLWPEYATVHRICQEGDHFRGLQIDDVNLAYRGGRVRIRRGFPFWWQAYNADFVRYAKRMFEHFPVTVVNLNGTDPQPCIEGSVYWLRGFRSGDNSSIAVALFDLLSGGWLHDADGESYANREYFSGTNEAKEDLVRACVRYGRKKAGLSYGVKDCHIYC